MKGKAERKRYIQLNAAFQRIAWRDKKDYFNEQSKELEFLQWLRGKGSVCNAGAAKDTGPIPGYGRCPGEAMATHSSTLAWRIP